MSEVDERRAELERADVALFDAERAALERSKANHVAEIRLRRATQYKGDKAFFSQMLADITYLLEALEAVE